jgi:acetoin utilization protein AcuC
MKTAFVYSDDFVKYEYGRGHPLKPFRLKLAYELMKAYGLLSLPNVRVVAARPAGEEDLLLYHTRDYIEALKDADHGLDLGDQESYGLGSGDNPVFEGLLEWSKLVAGASIQAAELVDSGEVSIAFNISGGLHHALASRASGFCYIDDPVILIRSLLKKGRRVAYIDIDVHHGDGVQDAFYSSDKVLTISLHESGHSLFPGTGFADEMGEGKGKGYSVNVPLAIGTDDELFVHAFKEIVPPLIERFSPDIVVGQLGVDSFIADPLAHLNITTNGYGRIVKMIKEMSPKLIALGGGGYEITNVAKAWTLAWAIMNDVDPPDDLPEPFLRQYQMEGFRTRKLRDSEFVVPGTEKERMTAEVGRVIKLLKEQLSSS